MAHTSQVMEVTIVEYAQKYRVTSLLFNRITTLETLLSVEPPAIDNGIFISFSYKGKDSAALSIFVFIYALADIFPCAL